MRPSPFKDYTANDARKRLPARPDYAKEMDDFLSGDLWRSTEGWIGELPIEPVALIAMERGLVSENILTELLSRYVAGVLGKEPRWQLVAKTAPRKQETGRRRKPPVIGEQTEEVPVPAEKVALAIPPADEEPPPDARIESIEADLTARWDRLHLLSVLQQAATHRGVEGRGPLYLLIPPGLRDEQGRIPRCSTLAEALEYIHIDARPPAQAGVYTDPKTRMDVGIVIAEEEDGTCVVELTYKDEMGRTVLKVFRNEELPQVVAADLGGHLFLHDRACPPLLNKQLVQAQKSITLTLTQMMRNVNLAGHRQIDYINAEPPGDWVAATEEAVGAKQFPDGTWKKFVPERIATGPSVRNFIQGNDIYNERNEKIGVTTPHVNVMDPVDVENFARTYAIFRQSAHVQCHQAHVLLDTDAPVSGISREQARADFKMTLGPIKAAMDDAGRWLIESILALAAELMQTPGAYADLRCEFGCVLNTGPLSPAEQEQIRANVEAGLKSRETAMSELGVDDVLAETEKIEREREERQARAPILNVGQQTNGGEKAPVGQMVPAMEVTG
jgi:hypothetical protein